MGGGKFEFCKSSSKDTRHLLTKTSHKGSRRGILKTFVALREADTRSEKVSPEENVKSNSGPRELG